MTRGDEIHHRALPPIILNMNQIIKKFVIDIDGVLNDKFKWSYEDSFYRRAKMLMAINPQKDMIKKVNEIYDQGHQIILHTSRLWHDFRMTTKWLKKHKVKYHTLIMAKPIGNYYIDDKNITMEEFKKWNNK